MKICDKLLMFKQVSSDCMRWIQLAQDSICRWDHVKTVLNLGFIKTREFFCRVGWQLGSVRQPRGHGLYSGSEGGRRYGITIRSWNAGCMHVDFVRTPAQKCGIQTASTAVLKGHTFRDHKSRPKLILRRISLQCPYELLTERTVELWCSLWCWC